MEPQKMKDIFHPTEMEQKHTPVIERLGDGEVMVRVGIIPHPMEDAEGGRPAHYIQWIEIYRNKKLVEKRDLGFGQPAEAEFIVADLKEEDYLSARALCNLHGLWESV